MPLKDWRQGSYICTYKGHSEYLERMELGGEGYWQENQSRGNQVGDCSAPTLGGGSRDNGKWKDYQTKEHKIQVLIMHMVLA